MSAGTDIIKMLPDHVANQIAAGEVIQRPASALKEILENAIDAASSKIQVIIKDAGKTLIQVIDDGCGMSETDARMCFERYATSKLKDAGDLQLIQTKGFRGEAMASIAAIAQVELKSKRKQDETATQIIIEGGTVKSQKDVVSQKGTSIAVKNLFFNTPARRNFLKSDPVETRHIIEEFQRIAIAHPELHLTLHHNDQEIFHLKPSILRQRLIGIFGKNFNERLVPVSEDTSIVNISGFIGKPEYARKTRGEQYFFVNRRFIKDAYLHHAVSKAFADNLPAGTFPSYFLFIEIDPKHVDINIHPTKTEIKFDDERSVYSILRAAVTTSIGKYSISPTLDFDKDPTLELSLNDLKKPAVEPGISIDKSFNPFKSTGSSPQPTKAKQQDWQKLYEGLPDIKTEEEVKQHELEIDTEEPLAVNLMQLEAGKIIELTPGSIIVYNQTATHQRILYEKNLSQHKSKSTSIQQTLFPLNFECSAKDAILLNELKSDLNEIGFDIREFGKNAFIIHGIPNYIKPEKASESIETILEQYKHYAGKEHISLFEQICKVTALAGAIEESETLNQHQMQQLISDLKNCDNSNSSPFGKPTHFSLSFADIDKHFNRKL